MEKTYDIENCEIKVKLNKGIISLQSDTGLWKYLDGDVKNCTVRLIEIIKKDYENQFDKALNIKNGSLMVEIWVHVYCDYYGLFLYRNINVNWIQKILLKGIKRAEVIDCGEKDLDTNRWVWDLLAIFKHPIAWVFPKNIGSKNLKY